MYTSPTTQKPGAVCQGFDNLYLSRPFKHPLREPNLKLLDT
jgi:hypothetical protein